MSCTRFSMLSMRLLCWPRVSRISAISADLAMPSSCSIDLVMALNSSGVMRSKPSWVVVFFVDWRPSGASQPVCGPELLVE